MKIDRLEEHIAKHDVQIVEIIRALRELAKQESVQPKQICWQSFQMGQLSHLMRISPPLKIDVITLTGLDPPERRITVQ
jgi:hypothetical protein